MDDNEIKIAINSFKRIYFIKKIYAIIFILIILISLILFLISIFSIKKKFTIINQINNPSFKTEKIMTNPAITIIHDKNKTYKIKGSEAKNINNDDIIISNVSVNSEILTINAGELKIQDNAEFLIFSKNPVLILNP